MIPFGSKGINLPSRVYIDGQRFKVRSEGSVREKTVYTVLGIDIEGNKDILGLWIADTESAKYWLSVLTDIKNRGVKDILIMTSGTFLVSKMQ